MNKIFNNPTFPLEKEPLFQFDIPMNEVLVIGHKNPDTDSVCSAFAYAALKRTLESSQGYTAARCGNLNKQTRYIFDKFEITPPKFVKDVYPKVEDLMESPGHRVTANTPLMQVLKNSEAFKVRSTPVVDDQDHLIGMINLLDLTHFFLQGTGEERPEYLIRPNNLDAVLKGHCVQTGTKEEFTGTVIAGAMSSERFNQRLDEMVAEQSVFVVGNRPDLVQEAIKRDIPVLILTGADAEDLADHLNGYQGWVFVSEDDTADTLRKVALSVPAKAVMSQTPSVLKEQYLDEAKDLMDSGEWLSLPVVDEPGKLTGVLSKGDLVKKEPRKLILMDHNEMVQAVDGAEGAEILEIIDHHRLGTIRTKNPVHFFAKPVGSTCTLVYQQYKISGEPLSKEVASLLLCGVLTDTVILKSPTATPADKQAIDELSTIAGQDYQALGIELFSATDSMKSREPLDVINTDFKVFQDFGVQFGIGQVEVVTLEDLPEVEEKLLAGLEEVRSGRELTLTMLLVTDIIKETSVLLTTEHNGFAKHTSYSKLRTQAFDLPNVLSRKKQLLPEVLRVFEELSE